MGKEQEWFNQLTAKRTQLAQQLKDPAAAGFWNSVVDKYSDEAHFIYELLQNSDDAKATSVSIRLFPDRLEYKHNGKIHFSITDPNQEGGDEPIGHLNAITSIGASNKQEGNTIGKFGIGFKSIFRYTDCPYIEDDHFVFEIHDFIVPIKVNKRQSDRKKEETLFLLPLKNAENDYQDILNKIRTLHHPLFFLSNLKKIEWSTYDGEKGAYQIISQNGQYWGKIQYDFVTMSKEVNGNVERMYFHRYIQDCAVAFAADAHQKPQPIEGENPLYCFFPTQEKSPLPFIVHAPFLLTDNREGIRFHEAWNIEKIKEIAQITGHALTHLAHIGQLGTTLFQIIPTDKNLFFKRSGNHPLSVIYTHLVQTLQTEPLFVTDDGAYVDARHTRFSDTESIRRLFSGENEKFLSFYGEGGWCFHELLEKRKENTNIYGYIQENHLIAVTPSLKEIIQRMSAQEIEGQEISWLSDFYICLGTTQCTIEEEPIFLCADHQAKALYRKSEHIPLIFLSEGEAGKCTAIHPELLLNEKCKKSLQRLGINEPGLLTEVIQNILPLYEGGEALHLTKREHLHHLRVIFDYYRSTPSYGEERMRYIQQIKEVSFLPTSDYQGNYALQKAEFCVIRSQMLNDYWLGNPAIYFLEKEDIQSAIEPENRDQFYLFLQDLGVNFQMNIRSVKRTPSALISNKLDLHPISLRQYDNGAQEIMDKEIAGWDYFIQHLTPQRSLAFFQLLAAEIQKSTSFLFSQSLAGTYSYVEKGKQGRTNERINKTTAKRVLLEDKWLYNNKGETCSATEINSTAELSSQYGIAQGDIFFFLGIKLSDELKNLTKEQREAIDIVNKFKEHGISIQEMEEMLKNRLDGKN